MSEVRDNMKIISGDCARRKRGPRRTTNRRGYRHPSIRRDCFHWTEPRDIRPRYFHLIRCYNRRRSAHYARPELDKTAV